MDESLKIRLLEAVGNDTAMRAILGTMMERTGAEFCAFHTARDRELSYVCLEARELSPRLPEIRERVRGAYRMFTNGFGPAEEEPHERVFCRRSHANVAYLVAEARIESYFLVPLAFGAKVRGVLFFGSVRKEAFGRNEIAVFRSLADEGEDATPLVFRVGGDLEVLDRMLAALPAGAALVSPDGRIVSANLPFREILACGAEAPESVYRVGDVSCFSLDGVWEEFSLLRRNIVDREVAGRCVPERFLRVSWAGLEDLSEEVGSLVTVRETTQEAAERAAREELVAMVAHELRTPLAGLKSSLSILESGGADDRMRFLSNARRTVDRLGRLVDGLIDSSTARLDERPLASGPHEVEAFLADVVSLFLEPMRRKEIALSISVDPRARVLTFDRDRIEQILQNLLANSMRHTGAGGRIAVRVAPCEAPARGTIPAELSRELPGLAFADLSVRDSGSGIPAAVITEINDAGGPARPARAAKGLGLVIAKRLARLHGGSLVVEEEPVEGSAVRLTLPVDAATARVSQRVRDIEARLETMLARGLAPAVAWAWKDPETPWETAAASWRRLPVIDPPRREPSGEAPLLWPLSDTFGLVLAARPVSTGAVGAAWASAPAEGTTIEKLFHAARARAEREERADHPKGALV